MTMDMSFAEMQAEYQRSRARTLRRLSLVLLVVAAVVSGLLLWRDLRDDRPHAEAGLVTEAESPLPVDWRRTVLVPGSRYDITAAVREDVTGDPAVADHQAPDGGTFVGLDIDEAESGAPVLPDRAAAATVDVAPARFTLVADDHRYRLTTDDTADSPDDDDDASTSLPLRGWLAVDGDAARLSLEVTWQGRTQRVDLRSGKQVLGDFAALYDQRSVTGVAQRTTSCGTATWTAGWRSGAGLPATCAYRVDRLAWSAQKGWAKPGRQWLAFTVSTSVPSDAIRRVGSRDVAFYSSGSYVGSGSARSAAESPDRLDGARPVALTRVDGFGDNDTALLLFDVPRRSGAHTAVVTQLVDVDERVEPVNGEYEGGVRQTWTVRIPA